MLKIFSVAVCFAAVLVISGCSETKETTSAPAVTETQSVQTPAEQEVAPADEQAVPTDEQPVPAEQETVEEAAPGETSQQPGAESGN
jgi:hypothetical protein